MSDSYMEKIRTRFDQADRDCDGQLDRCDFLRLLNSFGVNVGADQLTHIFRQTDRDNSGTIDFEEFKDACIGDRLISIREPRSWSFSRMKGKSNNGGEKSPSPNGDKTSMNGERTSLKCERTSLNGDRSSLNGERTSLNGDRASLNGERTSPTGERTSVSGERASLNGERTSLNGSKTYTNDSWTTEDVDSLYDDWDSPPSNRSHKSKSPKEGEGKHNRKNGIKNRTNKENNTNNNLYIKKTWQSNSPTTTVDKTLKVKSSHHISQDSINNIFPPLPPIMSELEVAECCKYFWFSDEDCDGKLCRSEFHNMTIALGMNLNMKQLNRALHYANTKKDGFVSFREFTLAYVNRTDTPRLVRRFVNECCRCDEFGGRYFTEHDCFQVVKMLGFQSSAKRFSKVFCKIDCDGDGIVSLSDLYLFLDFDLYDEYF